MDKATLNLLLDQAFNMWAELADFDPNRNLWTMCAYDTHKFAEEVQSARRCDPTGISAYMLLQAIVKEYLVKATFSLYDIITGLSKEQQQLLDKQRHLYSILQNEEMQVLIEDFKQAQRQALAYYSPELEDNEIFEDALFLSQLRHAAFVSIETLEAHQFHHGVGAPDVRCVYGTKVLEFWNMPSLVHAMKTAGRRRSINLCLLRDPAQPLNSHFVISIINGQTLTILTDQTKGKHPLYLKMTRRPDRRLEERAQRHWFPYDLLDIESDTSDRLRVKVRNQLVEYQKEAVPICDFKDLEAPTLIWLSLLFELIRERYLVDNQMLPERSYTGEMIRRPQTLTVHNSIVPADAYQQLEMPDFKHEDVTTETTKDQWTYEPCGVNEWLIERYSNQVPEQVLNIIGQQELDALPEHLGAAYDIEIYQSRDTFGKTEDTMLSFPLTVFGTEEDLKKDRLWFARYNQCQVINELARREQQALRGETEDWLHARIQERHDALLEILIRGTFKVDSYVRKRKGFGAPDEAVVELVRTHIMKDGWGPLGFHHKAFHLCEFSARYGYALCPITGSKAINYHAKICPQEADSLALVLGMSVDDLPWQLKHWFREDLNYYGNSILDRVDPAEWVLHNPWIFPIEISVALSRRGVNRMRKQLDLPPLAWEELEEDGEDYT